MRWTSLALIAIFFLLGGTVPPVSAQEQEDAQADSSKEPASTSEETDEESVPATPDKVNVVQVAGDPAIEERLNRILEATEWFQQPNVSVEDGVVFLSGMTSQERYREWAGRVAGNTEDVVAVVNRIKVSTPSIWDLSGTWSELREIARGSIQSIPLILVAVGIFVATWLFMKLLLSIGDRTALKRIENNLLREVARKALAVPVLLLGFYLMLKVSGLTRLAMTVIGGTGLVGLVIGFAFRDIAENFLSSVLLSIQNPFRYGDLIEVDGHMGFVQRVNTRGTLLMTLEGNHIQIPNSTIYKGTIINYSANANSRFDFLVGIGYDVAVTQAQEIAMQILKDHPAVLDTPEPQVLVEKLGASTVDLRVYAWVNAEKHSWIKVRSSLIRLVKRGFEDEGYEMPDDQREVIFPRGVPVLMQKDKDTDRSQNGDLLRERASATSIEQPDEDREEVTNSAEGNLSSEIETVKEQARQSRDLQEGSADLLETS